MLEKMDAFFDARVDGYEQHMLQNIAFAENIYRDTAALLPQTPALTLLDLGCGTGLELDWVYKNTPDARVTGVDLSAGMLEKLRQKHGDRNLTLLQGSYFDVPLGEHCYDACVSVESLHHFTPERKLPLYRKVYAALAPGGVYVEADYSAPDDETERLYFAEYAKLCASAPGEYHYDTPLTAARTLALLREAGFASVQLLKKYENTAIIRATK